jgi:hypothetical protein
MAKLKFRELQPEATLLRLDLGCGKGLNSPDGFVKVDKRKAKGVKCVDLRRRWPWKSNSVDEAQANYLLHCLTMPERVYFANELYRVMKPAAKATILVPHWSASRAFGCPDVMWPPVAEAWFPWLNKTWREAQNVDDEYGLNCNFDVGLGYGMHQELLSRNQEYQQHALQFWKEAAQDTIITLTKI